MWSVIGRKERGGLRRLLPRPRPQCRRIKLHRYSWQRKNPVPLHTGSCVRPTRGVSGNASRVAEEADREFTLVFDKGIAHCSRHASKPETPTPENQTNCNNQTRNSGSFCRPLRGSDRTLLGSDCRLRGAAVSRTSEAAYPSTVPSGLWGSAAAIAFSSHEVASDSNRQRELSDFDIPATDQATEWRQKRSCSSRRPI